jgi:predicted membrane chloride channel (bestrophin family)
MIDYSEEWLIMLLFRSRGSVACRASIFAIPCAILAGILVAVDDWSPDLRSDLGLKLEVLGKSQLWTATTALVGVLLSFRTNRAMARFWEGTGLLHQMRGEWFDSISCCVTFSVGAVATKRDEVKRFRHTIVRLMSLCHGSALEEIGGREDGKAEPVETIDSIGLDNATLAHLKACKEVYDFNRVEVLLHLTQSIITKSLDDGILKIPPPILSRVYQTLSRGFVNLLNAKKIADTRFPFPYAQLIATLLFAHTILTPVMMSCLIPSKVWAPIFTFVPLFVMFSINFIGVELENPFGQDDNDLPLEHFQDEMNKCLMMLLHDSADLIAGVSESRCKMDYGTLSKSMSMNSHLVRSSSMSQGTVAPRISVSDFCNMVDLSSDDKYNTMINSMNVSNHRSSTQRNHDGVSSLGVSSLEVSGQRSLAIDAVAEHGDRWQSDVPTVSRGIGLEMGGRSAQSEPKMRQSDFRGEATNTLPVLKQLVEKQVQELSRSIATLTQFSDALPGVIDTMLIGHSTAGAGPSLWRTAMLQRAESVQREDSDVRSVKPQSSSAVPSTPQAVGRGVVTPSTETQQDIWIDQGDRTRLPQYAGILDNSPHDSGDVCVM